MISKSVFKQRKLSGHVRKVRSFRTRLQEQVTTTSLWVVDLSISVSTWIIHGSDEKKHKSAMMDLGTSSVGSSSFACGTSSSSSSMTPTPSGRSGRLSNAARTSVSVYYWACRHVTFDEQIVQSTKPCELSQWYYRQARRQVLKPTDIHCCMASLRVDTPGKVAVLRGSLASGFPLLRTHADVKKILSVCNPGSLTAVCECMLRFGPPEATASIIREMISHPTQRLSSAEDGLRLLEAMPTNTLTSATLPIPLFPSSLLRDFLRYFLRCSQGTRAACRGLTISINEIVEGGERVEDVLFQDEHEIEREEFRKADTTLYGAFFHLNQAKFSRASSTLQYAHIRCMESLCNVGRWSEAVKLLAENDQLDDPALIGALLRVNAVLPACNVLLHLDDSGTHTYRRCLLHEEISLKLLQALRRVKDGRKSFTFPTTTIERVTNLILRANMSTPHAKESLSEIRTHCVAVRAVHGQWEKAIGWLSRGSSRLEEWKLVLPACCSGGAAWNVTKKVIDACSLYRDAPREHAATRRIWREILIECALNVNRWEAALTLIEEMYRKNASVGDHYVPTTNYFLDHPKLCTKNSLPQWMPPPSFRSLHAAGQFQLCLQSMSLWSEEERCQLISSICSYQAELVHELFEKCTSRRTMTACLLSAIKNPSTWEIALRDMWPSVVDVWPVVLHPWIVDRAMLTLSEWNDEEALQLGSRLLSVTRSQYAERLYNGGCKTSTILNPILLDASWEKGLRFLRGAASSGAVSTTLNLVKMIAKMMNVGVNSNTYHAIVLLRDRCTESVVTLDVRQSADFIVGMNGDEREGDDEHACTPLNSPHHQRLGHTLFSSWEDVLKHLSVSTVTLGSAKAVAGALSGMPSEHVNTVFLNQCPKWSDAVKSKFLSSWLSHAVRASSWITSLEIARLMTENSYVPSLESLVELLEVATTSPNEEDMKDDILRFRCSASYMYRHIPTAGIALRAFVERGASAMSTPRSQDSILKIARKLLIALRFMGVPRLPEGVLQAIVSTQMSSRYCHTSGDRINTIISFAGDLLETITSEVFSKDRETRPIVVGARTLDMLVNACFSAGQQPTAQVILIDKQRPSRCMIMSSSPLDPSPSHPHTQQQSSIINAIHKNRLESLWHVSLQLLASYSEVPQQYLVNRTLQQVSLGCDDTEVLRRLLRFHLELKRISRENSTRKGQIPTESRCLSAATSLLAATRLSASGSWETGLRCLDLSVRTSRHARSSRLESKKPTTWKKMCVDRLLLESDLYQNQTETALSNCERLRMKEVPVLPRGGVRKWLAKDHLHLPREFDWLRGFKE